MDLRVSPVLQDSKALPVHREPPDPRELWDHQEVLVRQVSLVWPVFPEPMVFLVTPETLDLLAARDLWVPPETPDRKDTPDRVALREKTAFAE